MSDFDAQAILRAVDENHVPDDWKIYRARKSYFNEWGIIWTFITFMILGAGAVIVLAISPSQAPTYTWICVAPIALMFLSLAIFAGREAISQFSQLRTIGTRVFVLTPEGCVARTGQKPNQIYGVAYVQIAAIAMSIQHSRYESNVSLILTYVPDSMGRFRRVQWRIEPQFEASDAIAQAIIEAHTRYAVTHTPMTAS